ncbi:hypothetical protein GCK32_007856 [Trichostrongylus colubriformis]|uniref:Uncharacterized protein n=1 Tax=Trichostrongylus colubriformis TaxID=6319 RepID=A0AAN8J311_TRICO
MCDRDRLCTSGDDRPSCLQLVTSGNEDDDDHGYHTPKNIFNAEMSRLSQLQLSHGQQAATTNHANESDAEDEENPYSTIKKCPLRSTMLKNLETLIEKNAADKVTTPQNTRSIFYNDASMDHMIRDLEHAATLKKRLPWLDRIGDIDRVDIALLISFILLVIFGFSGFYILVNEF